MDITIYWKDGSIERHTSPYPRDGVWDGWKVGFGHNGDAWYIEARSSDGSVGESPKFSSQLPRCRVAMCENARSEAGYVGWLEDNVTAITVDGYPFWESKGLEETDDE